MRTIETASRCSCGKPVRKLTTLNVYNVVRVVYNRNMNTESKESGCSDGRSSEF